MRSRADVVTRRGGWILFVVLAVAGCGGNGGDEGSVAERPSTPRTAPPEATSTLQLVADPKIPLRWTRKTYRTDAGRVELRLRNPSEAQHNAAVERSSRCCKQPGNQQLGYTNIIGPGETTRKVVELPAGRYWLYCNVEGHWQGGMVARLIVR
jgi:hypothetical protein